MTLLDHVTTLPSLLIVSLVSPFFPVGSVSAIYYLSCYLRLCLSDFVSAIYYLTLLSPALSSYLRFCYLISLLVFLPVSFAPAIPLSTRSTSYWFPHRISFFLIGLREYASLHAQTSRLFRTASLLPSLDSRIPLCWPPAPPIRLMCPRQFQGKWITTRNGIQLGSSS